VTRVAASLRIEERELETAGLKAAESTLFGGVANGADWFEPIPTCCRCRPSV